MAVKKIEDIELSKDWWAKKVADHIVGRKIIDVNYMTKEETKEFGWYHSAINIYLDNGFILSPMQDDEGNGAGAMCTNIKDLQTIPVWFGGSEREV